MYDTGTLLQIIFWGLYAGCIYILLATGLNLIFGVMKIVNFAHGEFLMIGAYITATIFFTYRFQSLCNYPGVHARAGRHRCGS